ANGFIGRNIGEFLSKNGFNVVNIVRKKKAIAFGKTIVSKSFSEDRLVSGIKNSLALLHFIGKGSQTVNSDYETVNVDTTKNEMRNNCYSRLGELSHTTNFCKGCSKGCSEIYN